MQPMVPHERYGIRIQCRIPQLRGIEGLKVQQVRKEADIPNYMVGIVLCNL